MNDMKKLREELKNKIDEVIDKYVSDDSKLLEIPDDNIYMEFELNGQSYIAFTESSKQDLEFDMNFAKVNIIDGRRILRNIEDKVEFQRGIDEFSRRLRIIAD